MEWFLFPKLKIFYLYYLSKNFRDNFFHKCELYIQIFIYHYIWCQVYCINLFFTKLELSTGLCTEFTSIPPLSYSSRLKTCFKIKTTSEMTNSNILISQNIKREKYKEITIDFFWNYFFVGILSKVSLLFTKYSTDLPGLFQCQDIQSSPPSHKLPKAVMIRSITSMPTLWHQFLSQFVFLLLW